MLQPPCIWPIYVSSSRACSGIIGGMTSSPNLDQITPEQLRALAEEALQLQIQVEAMSKKIQNDQTVIEPLTYEIALLNSNGTSLPSAASKSARRKAACWMTCSTQTLRLSRPS